MKKEKKGKLKKKKNVKKNPVNWYNTPSPLSSHASPIAPPPSIATSKKAEKTNVIQAGCTNTSTSKVFLNYVKIKEGGDGGRIESTPQRRKKKT